MVTGLATDNERREIMGYRKARIPIRLHRENQVDYRNGYIFDACLSNGELFEMGVYKNSNGRWLVSDLNTGILVCVGKTRVDAVKKFQDVYLSKFERLVYDNNRYCSASWCHENWYEHETAEFQAMLKEGAK